MVIKILYDNYSAKKPYKKGWGFACAVDNDLLFDTGEQGDSLLFNMKYAGIDCGQITNIVISHDHWDHTGGLKDVLDVIKQPKVYVCPDFGQDVRSAIKASGAEYKEVSRLTLIRDNVYSTGAITGYHRGTPIEEQSLVLKTEKGLVVITGCAHPGILEIIKKVVQDFPGQKIHGVFGGFHLMSMHKKELDKVYSGIADYKPEKVGPTHCTGDEAIEHAKTIFGSTFVPLGAGTVLEL